MGMDDFKITLLSDQTSLVWKGQMCCLEGASDCDIGRIHASLDEICQKGKRDHWTYDGCVVIWTSDHEGYFQGINLTGCLSYIKGGVEDCYKIYEIIGEKIPLKIEVLGQIVEVNNWEELYQSVMEMYREKIEIFKQCYGDIEIKTTAGRLRREIERRNSWLYKIFHRRR